MTPEDRHALLVRLLADRLQAPAQSTIRAQALMDAAAAWPVTNARMVDRKSIPRWLQHRAELEASVTD